MNLWSIKSYILVKIKLVLFLKLELFFPQQNNLNVVELLFLKAPKWKRNKKIRDFRNWDTYELL